MATSSGVGPGLGVPPIGKGANLSGPGSQRNVVLGPFSMAADDGEQRLHVLGVALEVDVARVHHEERGLLVVEEEVVVGAGEALDPGRVRVALELARAA